MFGIRRLLFALALVLTPFVFALPAAATSLLHTWVSNTGNDGNSCDITAPCASFAGAITKTAIGGEITCLNGGNYESPIAITNSITIDCQYSIGSTLLGGSNYPVGFGIQASAGSVVTLRGLDVDYAGATNNGGCSPGAIIDISGGGVVHLQKMKINHITGANCNGIMFAPTGQATLDVSDSDITDSGSSGTAAGIYVQPASGVLAKVTIENSRINNNYFGIIADGTQGGTIRGTISGSVVSGNNQNGITASSSGTSVVLILDQTKVSDNGNHGLAAAGSGAGMLVRNATVFNNGGGLFTENGSTLYSYGNNSVNGNNGNDGSFTGTVGLQ
jgi:hypothetical protein